MIDNHSDSDNSIVVVVLGWVSELYARTKNPTMCCRMLRTRRKKKYVCRQVPTGRFMLFGKALSPRVLYRSSRNIGRVQPRSDTLW